MIRSPVGSAIERNLILLARASMNESIKEFVAERAFRRRRLVGGSSSLMDISCLWMFLCLHFLVPRGEQLCLPWQYSALPHTWSTGAILP